jgi:hypothetical protein
MEFREKVLFLMNEKGLKSAHIAEALGWQRSIMSRFLSGGTLEFHNAFRLVKYLDQVNYLEILDEYCETLEKKSGILCALEYASNFGRHKLTDKLIQIHKNKKGEVAEYVSIYKMYRQRKSMSDGEILEFTKEGYGKTSSLELNTKILLIEAGMYFDAQKFAVVHSLLDSIDQKIKGITNKFVKESFQVRLSIFGANAELKAAGNAERSINYCDFLINSYATPDVLIASAYHTLGHACIFDSLAKSAFYFKKASELYKHAGYVENAKEVINSDLSLAHNIHKKEIALNITGEELAHQLIVRNEKEKALEVLSELEEETPYSILYKGMAEENFSLVLKAHGIMMKAGDNFFIKLFEQELFRLYHAKGAVLNG